MEFNGTTCEIMRLGTSNLFCKPRTHHVEATQRNEQSSEVWKSSSKDTDVYISPRAQYAHGRKNYQFHSAQEASELKLKMLEQCWGKYHC